MSFYGAYAEEYFNLGLKPTCISYLKTKYNITETNPQKSPCHSWRRWQVRKPDLEEIKDLPWNQSSGIGTVLGYYNRCIDIDNCTDEEILKKILQILRLPSDYEWAIKTPNGFHIHICAESLPFITNKQLNEGVISLLPNLEHKNKFSRIELRWANHAVLPPSVIDGKNYKFLYQDFPHETPKWIKDFHIFQLMTKLCGNYSDSGNWGNIEINEMIFQISASSNDYPYIEAIKVTENSQCKLNEQNNSYIVTDLLDKEDIVGVRNIVQHFPSIEQLPLFIDVETTGLIDDPLDYKNYPHIIQLAYSYGINSEIKNFYIKPDGHFTKTKNYIYYE